MARPRIYPKGTTASQRARASQKRFLETGGRVRCFRLTMEAIQRLRLLQQRGYGRTASEIIERLLKEAT
jgi:hypothetical protein